jgi:hypothetical protein
LNDYSVERRRVSTSLPVAEIELLQKIGGGLISTGMSKALDAWRLLATADVVVTRTAAGDARAKE